MPQAHAQIPLSKTSQPEPSDLVQGVLGGNQPEHLDAKTVETALASLLVRYPEASVLAAGANGVAIPMPASVPLQRNLVVDAHTGMELIVPGDRVRLLSAWEKVLTSGAARCALHLLSDPDTTMTYFGFDVREAHGAVLGVLVPGNVVDGPVEQASQRPRVTPRFARVSKDDSGVIIKIDGAATQILGWSADEMEGRRSLEFVHTDDHALAVDNWLEMLASPGIGRRVRLRHRRRDGSWIWFEITNNNLLDDPDYRCVVCEMVDISEEMAREQLLGRLAETVPVGLFQVDPDRRIVYTNDQLRQILGVEVAATAEAQLATVVEADRPTLEHALDGVLGQGGDADIEVEVQLPSGGGLRFCTISLRALYHGDGTISGAIACVADVTESTRMREELTRRATFDELTGCYNRPSIMNALEAGIASGQRRTDRAVMFIDLDRFKEVNDQQGHGAGDELLRAVSQALRSVVRADDLVGRIGGDEFLVVCPEIGGPEQAMKLAERIARALATESSDTIGAPHQLSASIGVAWSNGDGTRADTLVARADGAMYESKRERAGRPKLATADSAITAGGG